MNWEIVIGLETHAQLSTRSKIFSGASTAFGASPNSQASAVDIALPGVLPVLNRGAVERAIRFGLAVGGNDQPPLDFRAQELFLSRSAQGLPDQPVRAADRAGRLARASSSATQQKTVQLTRAHLEEDAGKSLHEDFHGMSGIDLNRAGTPLLEIVTEPDMRSAEEAVAYAKTLHALVRWIDICDGNMQEGSFRCDANVSVRRPGAPLGTRCEIKNLNSFASWRRRSSSRCAARSNCSRTAARSCRKRGSTIPDTRRDALDAFEGRCDGLSLLPRSGSCCRW